jgi:hypothetical protein
MKTCCSLNKNSNGCNKFSVIDPCPQKTCQTFWFHKPDLFKKKTFGTKKICDLSWDQKKTSGPLGFKEKQKK